jgi:hypothetical protein
MPIQAQIDGVGTLEFPDGTDPSVIQATVKKHVAQNQSGPTPSAPASAMDYAKSVGNAAERWAGQTAIGAISMILDPVVMAANAVPGKFMGPKDELPSSYWNRKLDQVTTPPTDTKGKVAEFLSSSLGMGALSKVGAVEKEGEQLAERGMRSLKGEEAKPLGRVGTKAAEDAHTAGYNLSPSYIGGPGRRTLQTVSGGPKVNQAMSESNQPVTDRLAKLAVDLHPQEDLEAGLERQKANAYKAYEAVRALGSMPHDPEFDKAVKLAGGRFATRGPSYGGSYRYESIAKEKQPYLDTQAVDAGETLDEIRALRNSSRANLKAYNPEANALGYTQREIANAMEDRIERYAASQKNPALIQNLKESRQQLAMVAAVEDSMGAGGHVNPNDLAKMLDKGMKLTGPLLTIAQTAKTFPQNMQFMAGKGTTGEFSAVDYLLGGTGLAAGHPAVAGLSLARPISRWTLQREATQRAMINDLRKPPPGPVRKAVDKASSEAGKATGSALKTAVRGGSILGAEDLADDSGK